jgi:hypothetical protein
MHSDSEPPGTAIAQGVEERIAGQGLEGLSLGHE